MTAKKQVIQVLRKEVNQLKTTIRNQKLAIKRQERRIATIKYNKFILAEELANDVDIIRREFNEELAWQALSGNPNDQLDTLNSLTKWIREKVDDKNRVYMEKHPGVGMVDYYHRKKIVRTGG